MQNSNYIYIYVCVCVCIPVSMTMQSSGNWNLLMRRYRMHLASLMQPLSSCLEYLYEIPQITAFFRPCALGGGPGGAWEYGAGGGGAWEYGAGGGGAWEAGGWGRPRGSAIRVTPWQMAQRMDSAPGGIWRGVRQWAQFTSMLYMVVGQTGIWIKGQG